MKWFILPVFVFVFMALNFVKAAEARSGCCSSHGGVCGCACCDGTSLSAKCAPYYPQCNRPVSKPTVKPVTKKAIPTKKPIIKPTRVVTKKLVPTKIPVVLTPTETLIPSPTITSTKVEPTRFETKKEMKKPANKKSFWKRLFGY